MVQALCRWPKVLTLIGQFDDKSGSMGIKLNLVGRKEENLRNLRAVLIHFNVVGQVMTQGS